MVVQYIQYSTLNVYFAWKWKIQTRNIVFHHYHRRFFLLLKHMFFWSEWRLSCEWVQRTLHTPEWNFFFMHKIRSIQNLLYLSINLKGKYLQQTTSTYFYQFTLDNKWNWNNNIKLWIFFSFLFFSSSSFFYVFSFCCAKIFSRF